MTEETFQDTADKVCEEQDQITQARTDKFVEIFDYMEANGIGLDSPEARQIALFATKEFGIQKKHQVTSIGNLQVEPENMTEYEFNRILSRARIGVKQIVEMRKKYVPIIKEVEGEKLNVGSYGPYFTNRKQRKALMKKILKPKRASQRPATASEIVRESKENHSVVMQ